MIAHLAGLPPDPIGQIITPCAPASAEDLRRAGWAWYRAAPRLADWALANVVCRHDCYGGFWLDREKAEVVATTHWTVADAADPLRRLARPLDRARLEEHFRGVSGLEGKVGCHVADAEGRCLWGVVDIDAHGPEDDVGANLNMANRVVAELAAMGLPFRLEDSDGKGGFHIWFLFGRPAPQPWAHRFGQFLVRQYDECGLAGPPEAFPKVAEQRGKRCGNLVRLPGLHHKREHWSRIWSPDGRRWLDSEAAIESLLAFRGDPTIDLARLIPADFVPGAPTSRASASRPGSSPPTGRPPEFLEHVDGEPAEVARARSAIAWLGVDYFDDYDPWIQLGMALKSLGDEGLELWDEASQPSDKYPGHAELEARWSTLREGEGADEITIASLSHLANEADWDGRYRVTSPTVGPRRSHSKVFDDPGTVVTPAMSDGWDDDFDRQVEALQARPDMKAQLAGRLGLTIAGLATLVASIPFGLKPTNRGKRADGTVGPLGPAWTHREADGSGRTVGIRRLFASPDSPRPELGCGARSTKRPDRPDRVGRISRRGLVTNLADALPEAGDIYLVRGLLDLAAVASRRLPCVGLPAGPGEPEAALRDLATLLVGDGRRLIVPYREGSADPWADARGPARALGRELGEGVVARSYPACFASICEYVVATRAAGDPGAKR